MKKLLVALVLALSSGLQTPAIAENFNTLTVQILDSQNQPLPGGSYTWESANSSFMANKSYPANSNGIVTFPKVPDVQGFIRMTSAIWVNPEVQVTHYKSNNFELTGTKTLYINDNSITTPKLFRVQARYANGQPIPSLPVSWSNISNEIKYGGATFKYVGDNGLLNRSGRAKTFLTDLFGGAQVLAYHAANGPETCFLNGVRQNSTGSCRNNPNPRLEDGFCYSSYGSTRELPLNNCGGWAELNSFARYGGATTKYSDGLVTETKSVITSEDFRSTFSFSSLPPIVLPTGDLEVPLGSALTIPISAGTTNSMAQTKISLAPVSGTSFVSTCASKTTTIKVSSNSQGHISFCPKNSGYYRVKTDYKNWSTDLFVKVNGTPPLKAEGVYLFRNGRQKFVNWQDPIYSGGRTVSKVKAFVQCGTTKKIFESTNVDVLSWHSLEIDGLHSTKACVAMFYIGNEFGYSAPVKIALFSR